MKLSIVAAIGENRELGKNNKLLWNIPEDLEHFKKITLGHPIIMGRKTYESIGRPLPNRTNIIVTRYTDYFMPDTTTCHSLGEAIQLASDVILNSFQDLPLEGKEMPKQVRHDNEKEIFIIGGGDIFAQSLPLVQKLYLTIVRQSFDADTFFPPYENLFTKIMSQQEGQEGDLKYTFLELQRA